MLAETIEGDGMPFLSVIVPIYNVEKYLVQCIESIINQTFTDMEIILVDDGGRDNCPSLCDKYAVKDSRIKVIHKKNGGLVSARKAGLNVSAGTYVAYVDGDDSIDKYMYEEMCTVARKTDTDIVVEGFELCSPNKTEIWRDKVTEGIYDKERLTREIYPVMMCHDNALQRNVAPAIWNKIFKRALLQSVMENMDERIRDGEDAAVTYPCFLLAKQIVFLTKQHHYQYRINPESMSRNFDKDWYKSASFYCEWLEQNVSKKYAKMEDSVRLEKFLMLYRYLNKEYLYSKGKKCFRKRISEIREKTDIGKNVCNVNVGKLRISLFGKLQYGFLKYKLYGMCELCCWCYYKYIN